MCGVRHEGRRNSEAERRTAKAAWDEIGRIRRECADVFYLECGEPELVAEHYTSGDVVVLCGTYRLACLLVAKEALEQKGARALYHPIATIPLFPTQGGLDDLQSDEIYVESSSAMMAS